MVVRLRKWTDVRLGLSSVSETIGRNHFYSTVHATADVCIQGSLEVDDGAAAVVHDLDSGLNAAPPIAGSGKHQRRGAA
jgi:hypothetical protein